MSTPPRWRSMQNGRTEQRPDSGQSLSRVRKLVMVLNEIGGLAVSEPASFSSGTVLRLHRNDGRYLGAVFISQDGTSHLVNMVYRVATGDLMQELEQALAS